MPKWDEVGGGGGVGGGGYSGFEVMGIMEEFFWV